MEIFYPDLTAVREVIVAGWAGRDAAGVQHHIDELAALGVAPPSDVPLFYRVGHEILSTAPVIDVLGSQTSGEVEPVLLRTQSDLLVGVGSDHTDRESEAYSVALSKQVCPKVSGRAFWRFADVEDRWDEVVLRSFTAERTPYQEGLAASLLPGPLFRGNCRDRADIAGGHSPEHFPIGGHHGDQGTGGHARHPAVSALGAGHEPD